MPVAKVDKILIVDDEPDILRLVAVVLEGTGDWSVVTASDEKSALEMARQERPVAILLDARLPETDGFAIFEQLQADAVTRDTPVILMTALAQRSNPSVPPGFAGVIPKPFDPDTLPAQIRGILRNTVATQA